MDRVSNAMKRRGHAAAPGSGPVGKTCRHCTHRVKLHYGNCTRLKCALMEKKWFNSDNTDISDASPACRLFQPEGSHDAASS